MRLLHVCTSPAPSAPAVAVASQFLFQKTLLSCSCQVKMYSRNARHLWFMKRERERERERLRKRRLSKKRGRVSKNCFLKGNFWEKKLVNKLRQLSGISINVISFLMLNVNKELYCLITLKNFRFYLSRSTVIILKSHRLSESAMRKIHCIVIGGDIR